MTRTKISLALALFACFSPAARAGFLGQTVTAEWYSPDNVTVIETHTLSVGAGIELPFGSIPNAGNNLQIDIADTTITFEFANLAIWTNAAMNGWKFSDTNLTIPPISNAFVGATSGGISGLTNAAITSSSDWVQGNFAGVTAAGNGDFWTIKVQFVPEPSSIWLAAGGLLAMFGVLRQGASQRR